MGPGVYIGDRSVIGRGSIVGEGVKLGTGAVLPEFMKVGVVSPNSLLARDQDVEDSATHNSHTVDEDDNWLITDRKFGRGLERRRSTDALIWHCRKHSWDWCH